MMSGGGRLAGIGVVYKYSSTDSISYGALTWQYPKKALFCNSEISPKVAQGSPGVRYDT
jgi:hypothetical protein